MSQGTEDLVFEKNDWVDQTIPEDTLVRARLESIQVRKFTYPDKRDIDPSTGKPREKEGSNAEWWWEVVDDRNDGLWKGRKVKGECKPEWNSNPRNKLNRWVEGLLGREIAVGQKVSMQDLVGLEARISVTHKPDRNDPEMKWERVDEIVPLDTTDEPPF